MFDPISERTARGFSERFSMARKSHVPSAVRRMSQTFPVCDKKVTSNSCIIHL